MTDKKCKACNGSGLVTLTDWVPYGSVSVSMDTTEYCTCIEDGVCPQCGWSVDWDDVNDVTIPCEHCGWDVENQKFVGSPEPKPYQPLTPQQVAILTYVNKLDELQDCQGSERYPESVAQALGYLLQEIDGDLNELAERKMIEIFSPSGQHAPTMLFSVNQS